MATKRKGQLQRVTRESLNNALTGREESLQKSLSSEDSSALLALMERATRRWAGQEMEDSIEELHADYERLALKYSLRKVREALDSLRIDSKQQFFPRPNELAAMIESQQERKTAQMKIREGEEFQRNWEAYMKRLMTDPDEIAWRIEKFGHDPYAGKVAVK